jgi:Zn-dependent protease with chaperone function
VNFFEHQEKARQSSRRLVILFLLGVAAIVFMVYMVAVVAFGASSQGGRSGPGLFQPGQGFFQPELFMLVAMGVLAVIAVGALLKFAALSAGGRAVAESLGGRLVQPGTRDPDERRLVNVVEEMAIASGLPVPAIYVLDEEPGINAFAAGRTPEDAAVAVTRGALAAFPRDELQGVIAHEFSHVLNGDMRLNIRLMGLLGGIFGLAVLGRILLHSGGSGRSRNKSGSQAALIGLALLIIGYIGVFVGRIIQAAISRQREFLADASGVQFTRNPRGLAGALQRIRDAVEGSVVHAPQAAEVSHMFFGAAGFSSMFATHPPLSERIRRIEGCPSPDRQGGAASASAPFFPSPPVFPSPDRQGGAASASAPFFPSPPVFPSPDRQGGAALGLHRNGDASNLVLQLAADMLGGAGRLTEKSMASGSRLLASVPAQLRSAVESPLGAGSLVCALLLDQDGAPRQAQFAALERAASPLAVREIRLLAPVVAGLERKLRLPLVDLAGPAIRQMSGPQHKQFLACVEALVLADARVTLFEFCLQRLVARGLAGRKARPGRALSPGDFVGHAAVLLSALARAGARDEAACESAFRAGWAALGKKLPAVAMPSAEAGSYAALAAALDTLSSASARVRSVVFTACTRCVLHDRSVTLDEAELLRAVAHNFDTPLPPLAE